MQEIINKTINNVINQFILNPYGFHETRKHHERVLHYLHHDFFIKNAPDSKYVFRWEFPTQQHYKTLPSKKLYVDGGGEPGYIDVIIKDSDETNSKIDYGFEYGLFECDKTEKVFRIKIENDILKLTDPINNVKNKYIMCFFRCNDFDRATPDNARKRIDTVTKRSKKFYEIMIDICNDFKTDSLKAIFVDIFLINQQKKFQIKRFPND